jgi:hypothetical protein
MQKWPVSGPRGRPAARSNPPISAQIPRSQEQGTCRTVRGNKFDKTAKQNGRNRLQRLHGADLAQRLLQTAGNMASRRPCWSAGSASWSRPSSSRCSCRCTRASAGISSPQITCSPTTRRSRSSIRDVGGPGQEGCGSMRAISEAGRVRSRQRRSAAMSPTARPRGHGPISRPVAAPCMLMAMPGSSR